MQRYLRPTPKIFIMMANHQPHASKERKRTTDHPDFWILPSFFLTSPLTHTSCRSFLIKSKVKIRKIFSTMKLSPLIFTASVFASVAAGVSAFAPPTSFTTTRSVVATTSKAISPTSTTTALGAATFGMGGSSSTINVSDEYAPRGDVMNMVNWARQYGVQTAPGVEPYTSDNGNDWQMITTQNINAGDGVVFVPSQLVLSSNNVVNEFGPSLQNAEQILVQIENGLSQRLPLFRLMIKILAEYDKGQESPYFPWLDSLPRQFYNGVAMTDACFDCLPPYAASLAMNERNAYSRFINAIRKAGNLPISPNTLNNDKVAKWAYNVALTRFEEIWQPSRQKLIAPMADLFNHSSSPNVEVTFDNDGNCVVKALTNIPANSQLTVSYGSPTNPTPIFAKYGFLPNDCQTIFCKALHLEPVIKALDYNFNDLLIQTATGQIAPKVFDIFLMKILQDNDQNAADQFYVACKTNDENTKQQFHQQYMQYTAQAMRDHVDTILRDVDQLTRKAQSYDLNTHPRVPVIVAHNNLVSETFYQSRVFLENLG